MRITTKGQVTIPQEIRDALGLLPNTEVSFDIADGRRVSHFAR
jgi:AbrB family looped-hinge helix DNA binding protein